VRWGLEDTVRALTHALWESTSRQHWQQFLELIRCRGDGLVPIEEFLLGLLYLGAAVAVAWTVLVEPL